MIQKIYKNKLREFYTLDEIKKNTKIIPGYSSYRIDKEGNIYSHRQRYLQRDDIFLKLNKTIEKDGYIYVHLRNDKGDSISEFGHKLVLMTYVGKRPKCLHDICHKNGIKTDNRLKNLKYCSQKENTQDKIKHNTFEKSYNTKYTNADIKIMHLYKKLGFSLGSIASRFGTGKTYVCSILNNKHWKHVKI